MKIQNLAVIFIIIILPISLILTAYVQNQVKTLELQMNYDTKLTTATYDAVKAFQLNTVNSSTSDLANSKLRDIKASVNTFFNSVATQFNLSGYNKDVLKTYVPALVYTMYDGFYIYSPFTNKLDSEDEGETYKNGDRVTDLKPYIHYSCRYKLGSDTNVVITYSLDNYITVQGIVNGKAVNKSGYVLNNITESNGKVYYRNVEIPTETLTEINALYTNSNNQAADTANYTYTKINGVKYYTNNGGNSWFSILNGTKYEQQNTKYKTINNAGQLYYKEAKEFTDWLSSTGLMDLKPINAVDEDGNSLANNSTSSDKFNFDYKIFQLSNGNTNIEDPNSNFNQHRLAVIRYTIERNLSIAIANYNNYSGVTTNFQMPKLQEDEWDKILNNVSVISFMQGLSIGGKIYNGYSIVANTKTEEVVNTDSIYLIAGDGEYHRATENGLNEKNITGAYLNTDFERKSIAGENSTTYFYPHNESASYKSIIMQNDVVDIDADYNGSIYKYMQSLGNSSKVAQQYYTTLGRERWSSYKTNNNPAEQIKKMLD